MRVGEDEGGSVSLDGASDAADHGRDKVLEEGAEREAEDGGHGGSHHAKQIVDASTVLSLFVEGLPCV